MTLNLGKESEFHEFKTSISQLDKGIRSLSAMLNRHYSGKVYFGVDDEGNVIGMDIGKDTCMDIRNRIRDLIEPQIVCDIRELDDGHGRRYIEVSANGSNIPYSFDGRYFIRNVSADESVSTNVLRKMLASGDSDLICQTPSPMKELTFRGLVGLLTNRGLHAIESDRFYSNYGLYNDEGEFNLMAYLLSDQNALSLKVVRFEGNDKRVMLERKDYTNQCLLISVHEILEYLKILNSVKVDLSDGIRKETYLFPYESFRESWINACMHNNWNEMVAPAIYVFDDRLEVSSYGGLPYNLDMEDFYRGKSTPVNRRLTSIFISVGLAEQTGHGIPIITELSGKDAFEIGGHYVDVRIGYNFEPDYTALRKAKDFLTNDLTEYQKDIVNHILKNPSATMKEISISLSVSESGVKKAMSHLQRIGLVKRKGSKKTGEWIVTP